MNGLGKSAEKIRVGISACLLGNEVRYDGGHKRDAYINGTLGDYFEFIPVCPEVAIGLGTPREPIRLVGDPESPRVVGVKNPTLDVTVSLDQYGQKMGRELADISGYILKRGSPSCGMARVKVYGHNRMPKGHAAGAYARAFMAAQPLLPVEEEGRLGDTILRENFIQRVFVYHRWQTINREGLTAAALVEFHTRHKLMVMAHSQAAYKRLGQLVSRAGKGAINETARAYISELMAALTRRATRKRHANVLMHLMGYLKRALDGEDKGELLETIAAYRVGHVPLIVPITLLNHHFRRHPQPYVEGQYYMQPHPKELMLRNTI